MKLVASVLALVLIGLTGGWLWVDAAADTQETEGIVVAGALEPGEARPPSSPGVQGAAGGQLLGAIQEGTGRLSEGFAQARAEAEQQAKDERAAEKKAEAERQADEEAKAQREAEEAKAQREAEEAARAQESQPAPVQPAPAPAPAAPVQPSPVMCWDDDEWEECDDGGDTPGDGGAYDDDLDDDWDDDWDD